MGRRAHMSSLRYLAVITAALLTAAAPLRRPVQGQEFVRGKLIDKVACREEPDQTYALYLPSAFDPDKKWPILFLFDPGARGATAVEVFREGAETYGWILAGSHGSRNGPLKDSAQAALAVWADISTRLPIDERRVYATGFSGGARVASFFPRVIGRPIAGVIGCGAGLASGLGPADLKAAAYFGLAGLADFNYGEMKGLDLAFDPSGVPHRFLYFEGTHDWPPSGYAAWAVGWMEVTAIKQGLRPPDPTLAAALVRRELGEADALEAEGRFYWAADKLEAAGRMAEGLDLDFPELAGLAGRIQEIKAGREYRRFLDAERKRDRRTIEFREEFDRAFGSIEDPDTGGGLAVPKVLRETGIAFLRKEAKSGSAIEDRSLASRLLFEFSFAAQARAAGFYGKRDLGRAGAYLDLAIAACEEGLPREKGLYFDRACVAALSGDGKAALKFLSLAVDKGVTDLELLESDKDLDPIRNTDAFREILERVRKKRGIKSIGNIPADPGVYSLRFCPAAFRRAPGFPGWSTA